jgi:hypothetical protein
MNNYANCGYVVNWNMLKKVIPADVVKEIDEALYQDDCWKANEVIDDVFDEKIHGLPFFNLYSPAAEDEMNGDMQIGEVYAVFDEDDLYVKVEKPELKLLRELNLVPQFEQWVTWG